MLAKVKKNRIDSPDFSNKISKILSASKACELLSRTTRNNRDLYIGLMGLEAVAKELLERAKNNNDQGKNSSKPYPERLPDYPRENAILGGLGEVALCFIVWFY